MLSSQSIRQETKLSFFAPAKGNFDREKYEKNIDMGRIKTQLDSKKNRIVIDELFSNEKGCGFGAAAIRSQVKRSIEEKCAGNIELDACWSSHLFYLYMGMVPIDRLVSYVRLHYGCCGEDALKNLAKCTNETEFQILDEIYIKDLKRIMHNEFKIPEEKNISLQEIFSHRDDLIALLAKNASYIKDEFIPMLLRRLKRSCGEKYPDTSCLTSVWMTLAPEGKERWLDAIQKNNEFVPFKDLSHLKSYLTDKEEMAHFEKVVDEYRKSLSIVKPVAKVA